MIDKILDFKDNMSISIYNDFFREAKKTGDARTLFLLAYYVKCADIKELSLEIIKTNNLRYIIFFMRAIPNIDKDMFLDKILEIASTRECYYCLYDNRDLIDEQIFRLIDRCMDDDVYGFLSVYHYFITIDRFNLKLFRQVKKLFGDRGILINEDNYKDVLREIRDKKFADIDCAYKKGFSSNCYIGRNGYVPDMIVLHNTLSFNKTINNFYDEKKEVSAHYVIDSNGDIKQVVSLDDSAWANGTSINENSDVYYRFAKNEIVRERKCNANYYTFSIENISFDGELTDMQYESLKKVIKDIIKYIYDKYNYRFEIDDKHIVGHRDINPIVRTICPGNKFPMEKLIDDLKKEI